MYLVRRENHSGEKEEKLSGQEEIKQHPLPEKKEGGGEKQL